MTRRILLALIATLGAVTSDSPVAGSKPVASEIYYRCAAEFILETRGDAVRCRKPATLTTRPLAVCPIGLYPTVDRIGNNDMCAATNPFSGEISIEQGCKATDVALGYSKRMVNGRDYCAKTNPPEIQVPSVEVSLRL